MPAAPTTTAPNASGADAADAEAPSPAEKSSQAGATAHRIGPGDVPHLIATIGSWLGRHGGKTLTAVEIIGAVCDRLYEAGVPLAHVMCGLSDVHPQIEGMSLRWTPGGGVQQTLFAYSETEDDLAYLASPVKAIRDGAAALRRPLYRADCPMDYPVLEDRKAEGATDYLATELVFTDASRSFMSWTTHAPGGFSYSDLAVIDGLLPLVSLRLEIDRTRTTCHTLLQTYLGRAAAERVEQGTIRRFQCETLHAIVVYCDLRGFTAIADRLPPEEVIRVLGLYHETISEPIQYFGGDIVKIIADGVLSIFPLEPGAPPERVNHVACGAHAAVRRALAALDAITSEDLPEGVEGLRAGFALHAGEVAFGNVGSADRLDFTVIGPAVNEAVRVEALTKDLGVCVLATAAFAGLDCTVELRSIGFHRLRGVRQPKELFSPQSGS